MNGANGRVERWGWGAGAVLLGAGLPLAVALAVNARRPDLIQPVLDHRMGLWLVAAVGALSAAATVVYLVAVLARFERRASRRVLAVAGFLLCSLPALLAIALGPLAFTFMYGAAG